MKIKIEKLLHENLHVKLGITEKELETIQTYLSCELSINWFIDNIGDKIVRQCEFGYLEIKGHVESDNGLLFNINRTDTHKSFRYIQEVLRDEYKLNDSLIQFDSNGIDVSDLVVTIDWKHKRIELSNLNEMV